MTTQKALLEKAETIGQNPCHHRYLGTVEGAVLQSTATR